MYRKVIYQKGGFLVGSGTPLTAVCWRCVQNLCGCVSTLSMAVPFSLARYVQVVLTEVKSSQYDNTPILQTVTKQMVKEEDWKGRKEGKKEEERKVGSEDEGKGGSKQYWTNLVVCSVQMRNAGLRGREAEKQVDKHKRG